MDEREKDGDEEEEKDEDGVRRLEDGVKERLREDVEADRGKLRREVTSTLNFTEVPKLISSIKCFFPGVHDRTGHLIERTFYRQDFSWIIISIFPKIIFLHYKTLLFFTI